MGPIAHLYRAEVGRLTAYRVRMDTTTNWAVSTMAALVAFSLGSATMPHYFFAFILFLQLIFCAMEARRYSYYILVRHRCRLLERGLFMRILVRDLPAAQWREPLRLSYTVDAEILPFWTSFVVRLNRNYMFMILVTFVGWTFKLITLLPQMDYQFPWHFYAPIAAFMVIAATLILFFVRVPRIDV